MNSLTLYANTSFVDLENSKRKLGKFQDMNRSYTAVYGPWVDESLLEGKTVASVRRLEPNNVRSVSLFEERYF